MRIYPTPPLLVRDPIKRDALPSEGREVADDDIYWQRRLGCGDATLKPPVQAEIPAETVVEQPTDIAGSDAQ